ncbi:MAG: heme o synthase [Alphaproteobacteria bacterium]|nr:heme o synthase [Alphaproteobacteria bacterium]
MTHSKSSLLVNGFTLIKAHLVLIKFTLSITVVFSAVISYLLAPHIVHFSWFGVGWLSLGGIFVTGAANALNQAIEKDSDKLMKRTAVRPVANGTMSQQYAQGFAYLILVVGLLILYIVFNALAASIALLSFICYVYIYTPLKRVNSLAVFVGAFPGAFPCLIGWAAGNDNLSLGGWILFLLQFFWQFPHFWAIAWIAHNDYTKVGFKLLPSGGLPTKITALQTILYCLILIPIGMLPFFLKMSGITSLWIILGCNILMVMLAVRLYITMKPKEARIVMFASYLYLPIVLLSLLFNKIQL